MHGSGTLLRRTLIAMTLAVAACAPAAADFDKGVQAAKQRKYDVAFAELLPEAEAGNPRAQVYVANMYLRGLGTRKDEAEAARWYRAAAEQGEPTAMYNFGVHLRDGVGVEADAGQSSIWFEKAARLGYPPAMLNLGIRYFNGRGVERDEVLGYAWVYLAASKGSVPAIRRRKAIEDRLSREQVERGRELARTLR